MQAKIVEVGKRQVEERNQRQQKDKSGRKGRTV